MLQENSSLGFDWANMRVDDVTGVIAFDSGVGDGFYASYFGYDTEGYIVNVVTEFLSGDLAEQFLTITAVSQQSLSPIFKRCWRNSGLKTRASSRVTIA